ncbi:MAG: DUF1015 domain-containing protein [Alkalispirochaetaceae bacterium]
MTVDTRLAALALRRPDILLPRQNIDLKRWAVIACDQHTSNPDYWQRIEEAVGEEPSTLRLILPEVYLSDGNLDERAERIGEEARRYLEAGILRELPTTPILVIRESLDGRRRPGMLFALDLEAYDYNPGSSTLVRASELTIATRLPPRVKIRQASVLELPHILVLIDDPTSSVIEPVADRIERSEVPLYRTELLARGGTVAGYALEEGRLEDEFVPAMEALNSRGAPFLYAAGDGNHSLAAAKEVWEARKRSGAPEDHPSRYALVEIVNLYTPGLRFEPIHRLVTGPGAPRAVSAIGTLCEREEPSRESREPGAGEVICHDRNGGRRFRLVETGSLPVAQVDAALSAVGDIEVDYVHGAGETVRLAEKRSGVAVLLPSIDRSLLFPTVSRQGALPRKAFSLGESEEKRYYMEARRIE